MSTARNIGDTVTFGGPLGRKLYPSADGHAALGDAHDLYVARTGGDKIPPATSVKPWRFEIVRTKQDPRTSTSVYMCVYVPYTHHPPGAATKEKKRARLEVGDVEGFGEGANAPEDILGVETEILELVESAVRKAKSAGKLTKGETQEHKYRLSLRTTLRRLMKPFVGVDLNPKWVCADCPWSFAKEP